LLQKKDELGGELDVIDGLWLSITNAYQHPQSSEAVQHDPQVMTNLHTIIEDALPKFDATIEWLKRNEDLPENVKTSQIEELKNQEAKLNDLKTKVDTMKSTLNEELSRQRDLDNKNQHIIDDLNRMKTEFDNALKLEDPNERTSRVEEIRQKLPALQQEVDSLVKDSEIHPRTLIKSDVGESFRSKKHMEPASRLPNTPAL